MIFMREKREGSDEKASREGINRSKRGGRAQRWETKWQLIVDKEISIIACLGIPAFFTPHEQQ